MNQYSLSSSGMGLWVYVELLNQGLETHHCDIKWCQEDGRVVDWINNMQFRSAPKAKLLQSLHHSVPIDEELFVTAWQPHRPVKSDILPDRLLYLSQRHEETVLLNTSIFCIHVSLENSWHILNSTKISLDKNLVSDYERLLRDFGIPKTLLVYDGLPLEGMKPDINGLLSLLSLIQALIKLDSSVAPRLIVLSRNAYSINGHPNTPAASAINGLLTSVLAEYPFLKIRQVDIESEVLLESHLTSLLAEDSNTLHVWRGTDCYVPRLRSLNQIQSKPSEPELKTNPLLIDSDGFYLIIGGLGGLGLLLTEYLLSKQVKRICLTARHEASEEVTLQLQKLSATYEATISTEVLDVSNQARVNDFIANLSQLKVPLSGMFHLAGVLDDASIPEQTLERLEHVLSGKALGAYYLHEATKQYKTPIVFFSSIAALLGSAGQTNYAIANAYLDSLAAYRMSQGLESISIAWGPWADVGMASLLQSVMHKNGFGMLDKIAAFDLLDVVLRTGYVHMGAAVINWEQFARARLKVPPFFQELVADNISENGQLYVLLQKARHSERLNLLMSALTEMFRETLGFKAHMKISQEEGFFNLGMDSIMAVTLRNKVQLAIGAKHAITVADIFNYSDIKQLSTFLVKKMGLLEENTDETKAVLKTTISDNESIAIIGMGCRYPGGANSPEAFWELLKEGYDGISDIPKDRWNVDEYYSTDKDAPGKLTPRKGGFLNFPVADFDAGFFRITPRQAEMTDPMHRLLLEVSWEALEDAGIAPSSLKNTETGVYVGVWHSDYADLIMQNYGKAGINSFTNFTTLSAASGILSFFYGLKGPSYSVDTACSSSLVALDGAVKGLQSGECDIAIVAGANMILTPDASIGFDKAGMLSPDSSCKTFDESANGYVRGEGIGVIIVKRLNDAMRDNDKIYGVIKGIRVNHNGPASGLTVPNGLAQQELILHALAASNLKPQDVDYVECHGTGTALGDPIEVSALNEVFAHSHTKSKPLYLGSVKSNIGHLEATAGLAGLMKVLLAMKHDLIPPNIHFQKLNSKMSIDAMPAQVVTNLTPWGWENKIKVAGVNSFGATGINAHVILEEGPAVSAVQSEEGDWVLGLSAKTPSALSQLIQDYISYLEANPNLCIQDLVYTANTGRALFEHQACFSASSVEALLTHLKKNERTSLDLKTPQHGNKIALPTYPFERESYWIKGKSASLSFEGEATKHPLLGFKQKLAEGTIFNHAMDVNLLTYLKDHVIWEHCLFPGAGFLEMMTAIAQELPELSVMTLEELAIEKPLLLSMTHASMIHITIHTIADNSYQVKLYQRIDGMKEQDRQYQLLATARFMPSSLHIPVVAGIEKLQAMLGAPKDAAELYPLFNEKGLNYGPSFQALKHIQFDKEQVLGELMTEENTTDYYAHPVILDGAFQALAALLPENTNTVALPVGCIRWQLKKPIGSKAYVYARKSKLTDQMLQAELYLLNKYGQILAYAEQIQLKLTTKKQLEHVLGNTVDIAHWFYREDWFEKTLVPGIEPTAMPHHHLWIVYDEHSKQQQSVVNELHMSHPDATLITVDKFIEAKSCDQFIDAQTKPTQVLYLASMLEDSKPYSDKLFSQGFKELMVPFIHMTQNLLKAEIKPALWMITHCAKTIDKTEEVNLLPSAFNGLIKTLLWEYPDLALHHLDVDLVDNVAAIWQNELQANSSDSLVLYRGDIRYVPHLVPERKMLPLLEKQSDSYRLVKSASNHLEDLSLASMEPISDLQEQDVLVSIEAVGLNFRDVLNALGLYPGDPGPLGGDAVGRVLRVGSAVKNVVEGDWVFGLFTGALASHAVTHANLIAKVPDSLSQDKRTSLASIPTVFMTSFYGLVELAGLKAGERVLIHAAAGGVGQAAIQVAGHLGARIYVTAGSDIKKEHLKAQGIEFIYSSRDTDFSDSILKDTQGHGVDVVLNCLSGPGFIEASVKCCSKGARFLEIGKRDVWTPEMMKEKRPDIDYHLIALDDLAKNHPQKIQDLLQKIIHYIVLGDYQPIPQSTFSLERTVEAFQYLKQAEHIGKVVIDLKSIDLNQIKSEPCYLISGGLGGLGLSLARYLLQHGAKHLILTTRTAPSDLMQSELNKLAEDYVATINTVVTDVSKASSVKVLYETIKDKHLVLGGVFHLAGMLNDATYSMQNWESFDTVFVPKIMGVWHLHQLCEKLQSKPDFFVHFSSIASVLGHSGQSNYAAANSVLDSFAQFQSHCGMNSQSINWGGFSEVGMAKELTSSHSETGILPMKPVDGMRALLFALEHPATNRMIANIDFARFTKLPLVPFWLHSVFPKEVSQVEDVFAFLMALPEEKRLLALQEAIATEVAAVMNIPIERLKNNQGFFDLGMDSLMAVELKNRLQKFIGQKYPLHSTLIFDYPNVDKLTLYLTENKLQEFFTIQSKKEENSDDTLLKKVDQMTEVDFNKLADDFLDND